MKNRLLNYINLTRINRPTGIGLLFLPCLFGIFLAVKKVDLSFVKISEIVFLFFIGSVVMRSAGCVINDLFDKKFDSQVARTKSRPLAAGKINHGEALFLLIILLAIGFLILINFNLKTILSGFLALALMALYPLMKRITYYPQLFLGLTFNFGILMGSLAVLDRIDLHFLLLYFSAICWTLIYDTIYAYQDLEDDLKIGVKSTAIRFGENPRNILFLLALSMFSCLFYLGSLESLEFGFFLANLTAFFLLIKKITLCNFKNPQNCLEFFKHNLIIGILILTGIILG